jgi:hypothetical protein
MTSTTSTTSNRFGRHLSDQALGLPQAADVDVDNPRLATPKKDPAVAREPRPHSLLGDRDGEIPDGAGTRSTRSSFYESQPLSFVFPHQRLQGIEVVRGRRRCGPSQPARGQPLARGAQDEHDEVDPRPQAHRSRLLAQTRPRSVSSPYYQFKLVGQEPG